MNASHLKFFLVATSLLILTAVSQADEPHAAKEPVSNVTPPKEANDTTSPSRVKQSTDESIYHDVIFLKSPVTYAENATVTPEEKSACRTEAILEKQVLRVIGRRHRLPLIASGDEASSFDAGKQILKIQITDLRGFLPAESDGTKGLAAMVSLTKDNKTLRQAKVGVTSMGGLIGMFKSDCTILKRASYFMARDIAKWTYDPNYKMPEELDVSNEADNKDE